MFQSNILIWCFRKVFLVLFNALETHIIHMLVLLEVSCTYFTIRIVSICLCVCIYVSCGCLIIWTSWGAHLKATLELKSHQGCMSQFACYDSGRSLAPGCSFRRTGRPAHIYRMNYENVSARRSSGHLASNVVLN